MKLHVTVTIGGSRGARPARAPPPPLRVQILSFWHAKFSKRSRLGGPQPPIRGPRRPPTGNPGSATGDSAFLEINLMTITGVSNVWKCTKNLMKILFDFQRIMTMLGFHIVTIYLTVQINLMLGETGMQIKFMEHLVCSSWMSSTHSVPIQSSPFF